MKCPCGSTNTLEACCGPLHDGAKASTAEALMRSRYAAYALELPEYLHKTHDPATREDLDMDAVRAWSREASFLGLQVKDVVRGGEGDDDGEVEFVATFIDRQGKEQHHHERSTFVRKEGTWLFHEGGEVKGIPVVRTTPKVGRNDPCTCGSGKKHKKCCGRPNARG